jgi:UDP-N-acetylglucosamine 2-epimerase (non-hydrolysing)
MKILTIAGTRPELIRLSIIIGKLDKMVDHVFVYTNQNYTTTLKDYFFTDLDIRQPDYTFDGVTGTFGEFMARGFKEFESILCEEEPDKILVLGDTNSGLLTLVANRFSIPIYHMEAGNRCYDKRVPEETNRRLIDHLSTYNLPYTDNSKQNLIDEGFDKNYVLKTGNPIYEVLMKHEEQIESSNILNKLRLKRGEYVLVTAHRAENVDNLASLTDIVSAITTIGQETSVIVSLHPRTQDKLRKYDLTFKIKNVIVCEPFNFFDFVKLESNAKIVISDSGTVQEECCIYGIPSLTIRQSTERHETIECGSNILTGTKYKDIITAYKATVNRHTSWISPYDYIVDNVSDTVINILLGK